MKEVTLIYTATWSTTVEVPNDFQVTPKSVQKLAEANERDFDFQDGGAEWQFDPVDSWMSSQ